MSRLLGTVAALLVLAACDGTNPITGGGGGVDVPTDSNDVPASLAGNLAAMGYDAGSQELTLEMSGLDAGTVVANYAREPSLDVGPYEAYITQDDPLDRMFTALVAESFDGSVQAVAVADGGQFNRYFGGSSYRRTGGTGSTMPATGLASYAGSYAGVTNIGTTGNLLPPDPGSDPDILPEQSTRTSGDAFFDVDFAEGSINGAVYNRQYVGGGALDTIVMIRSSITAGGSFDGVVELGVNEAIGTYGGIFGGANAAALAGTVKIANFDSSIDNEEEYGVFVLTRCGLAGADAACDGSN